MSITINELTITVPGNVVKTFSGDGKDSNLRVTQAQAQSLYDQLGPVLAFFAANGGAPIVDASKIETGTFASTGQVGSQEALKDQVDGVKR